MANTTIVTLSMKFSIQAHSGMGMSGGKTNIDCLMIMGNYVVSHNHQPDENEQRCFYSDPFSQILKFSANVVLFK